MNLGAFVEIVEQEYGPIYRRIKVLDNKKPDGTIKKEPKWERNQMTKEEIDLDRGYEVKHQDRNKVFTDYSIYLKHCPDLWCVDVDTKDWGNAELVQHLIDAGCYSTETNKGFHFYIKCPDVPQFTNEIEVFKEFKGDFLGRNVGCNVWEKKTRTIEGNHFTEFSWDELSQYIDLEALNQPSPEDKKREKREKKAKQLKEKKQAQEDPDPYGLEDFTDDMIRNFLDRINNSEGKSRHYDDWLKIGICLFNCYKGKSKGRNLWNEWSSKSPKHDEDALDDKYDTFKNDHPDPAGWKTLRHMADIDNPRNPYQALYEQRGEDGMVLEMNKNLCFNQQTSEYIRQFENIGKHDEHKWGTFKKNQAQSSYDKYKFWITNPDTGKKTKVNPFDIWNENINRRDVKRIVFDPRPQVEQDPDVFNIWQGYVISAEDASVFDEDDCQALLDHIFNIWCRCRQDHYDYVINWFAHILQKPWQKISVLLALQSAEGAGKGVVLEMIGLIMGSAHFKAVANVNGLIGDFNGELEGKCLIDLDEAVWGGDVKTSSKMKNLITESRQQVNKKHKESYEIDNSTAFMITTNNELFAGVEKGARRYACLRLDDRFAGIANDETDKYFSEVRGVPSGVKEPSPAVVGAFAKYLYKRDLRGWSARRVPKTDLLQDQIERSWASVVKWWWDMLGDGRFGLPDWEKAYKNHDGMGEQIKRNEYTPEMEYYGHIVEGVNGRVVKEKYKVISGTRKFYRLKNFPGSLMPSPDETKKQWLRRVYVERVPSYNMKERIETKDDGTPKEYTLQWGGNDIVEYEVKEKVVYSGYYPKWLYQVYLECFKNRRLGYGNPDTYNSWCQKMRKLFDVKVKKHGSASANQDQTWQLVPLEDVRQQFNESQQYEYQWNEAEEVVPTQPGGKLLEGNGKPLAPGQGLNGYALDTESDEDPVPE